MAREKYLYWRTCADCTPIFVVGFDVFHAFPYSRTAHIERKTTRARASQHLQELVVLSGAEGFGSVAIEGTTSLHLKRRHISSQRRI